MLTSCFFRYAVGVAEGEVVAVRGGRPHQQGAERDQGSTASISSQSRPGVRAARPLRVGAEAVRVISAPSVRAAGSSRRPGRWAARSGGVVPGIAARDGSTSVPWTP